MAKNLIVIPARSGSKSILNKNMVDLGGKPLIYYTLQAALDSGLDADIYCSTDSQTILDYALAMGLTINHLRPPEISTDTSTSVEVILHAITLCQSIFRCTYKNVILLQPTSPFRTSAHINECFSLFINTPGLNSIASVVKISHTSLPSKLYHIQDGHIVPRSSENSTLQRQQCKTLYARNGSAIYISTQKSLLASHSLISGNHQGYEMSYLSSLDINNKDDLILARALISYRQ